MAVMNPLEQARAADARGELSAAEHHYVCALTDPRADPIDSAKELATLYGRAGRHFECMLLARCALRRARASRDPLQEARALGVLCTSLANIPAHARLVEPLAELETLLGRCDDPRAWRMHKTAAFALALHEDRIADAQRLLAALRERVEAEQTGPHELGMLSFFEMRLARQRGDDGRHLELLGDLVDEQDDGHPERLPFLTRRAHALSQAGRMDDARATAERALALLRIQDDSFISEIRASEGARLGRFFWERLHDLAGAREAFDLVTAAMLNRMLQLDATVARLEKAGVLEGADEAVFDEMRTDFMDAIVRMLREISTIQRQAAAEGAAAVVFDQVDDEALRVCAWCDSVQVPGDVWLPLGQFAPRTLAARVTHGMCEPCYEQQRAAFA